MTDIERDLLEVEEQLVEESRLSVCGSPKKHLKFYNVLPEINRNSTQFRLRRRNTLASKPPFYSSKIFQISPINLSHRRRRSSPMRHREQFSFLKTKERI